MTKMMKKISIAFLAAALLLCGSALALTGVSANESAGAFEMETGAEVRLDDPSGIRFITKVDQAFIDNLEAENPDKEISFGTEIKPEGKDVAPLDIPQTVWAAESTETVKYFKAVLTDIPESQYLTKLTATAYYAVDGVKTYAENPQTRSIAYVASAAIAAGNDSAELTAIIDAAVAEISLGEDFTLNVGDEKTLAVTGGEDLVVKFSTDNDAVATVDENGVVRAVGAGTANITATLGSRTDSVAVTVNAVKKLFYSFEEEEIGAVYDNTLFASAEGNEYMQVTNIASGCTDGEKCLYRNANGSGYPAIIIRNKVLQDFYSAYGGISFDIFNNGANLHNGYYTYNLGDGDRYFRVNLEGKTGATITVTGDILKSFIDSGKDLRFDIMNDGATFEHGLEYYLDNVRGPELGKVVEQGETLSAADLLGTNATLKSFAVYKDNALVSEEGAENYTFTEKGNYTFECVQTIEGYEDSTVKGTVRVIDAVFDSVEEFYGADKLIVSTHEMNEPTVAEYKGVNALRFASNGGYPRLHLNKGMFEEITAEGKTFTLWFYFSEIEGAHGVYLGQKKGYVYDYVSDNLGELVITPEIYESTKTDAEFAENIPITVNAYTDGTNVYDPYVLHLLGYSLS